MGDVGCRMTDTGYWILDTGYWILDNNYMLPTAYCLYLIFISSSSV
jgi:hypothetical protein